MTKPGKRVKLLPGLYLQLPHITHPYEVVKKTKYFHYLQCPECGRRSYKSFGNSGASPDYYWLETGEWSIGNFTDNPPKPPPASTARAKPRAKEPTRKVTGTLTVNGVTYHYNPEEAGDRSIDELSGDIKAALDEINKAAFDYPEDLGDINANWFGDSKDYPMWNYVTKSEIRDKSTLEEFDWDQWHKDLDDMLDRSFKRGKHKEKK